MIGECLVAHKPFKQEISYLSVKALVINPYLAIYCRYEGHLIGTFRFILTHIPTGYGIWLERDKSKILDLARQLKPLNLNFLNPDLGLLPKEILLPFMEVIHAWEKQESDLNDDEEEYGFFYQEAEEAIRLERLERKLRKARKFKAAA